MKKITLKALGLLMTIFTLSQVFHTEEAHATPPKLSAKKKIALTIHDTGCNCTSCMQPAQQSTQKNPTKKNGISAR